MEKAFDSDPVNRKQCGVRSYKISRKIDDPNYVMVDLEFDNLTDAEACHEKLRNLWNRVRDTVMNNPQSRIIEVIDSVNLH